MDFLKQEIQDRQEFLSWLDRTDETILRRLEQYTNVDFESVRNDVKSDIFGLKNRTIYYIPDCRCFPHVELGNVTEIYRRTKEGIYDSINDVFLCHNEKRAIFYDFIRNIEFRYIENVGGADDDKRSFDEIIQIMKDVNTFPEKYLFEKVDKDSETVNVFQKL